MALAYFAGAGSLAYVTLTSTVSAYISGGTVSAGSSIYVQGQSIDNLTNTAGAASGAIAAAGAAISQSTINTNTNAYVTSGAVLSALTRSLLPAMPTSNHAT